ncbi:hypothetical protein F5Y16DRAFT_357564 [Xylariaceae sp. FL0255]|nr:hypothetical protein F5Y16DRAFT_357564 [Xylariaceae sp. FL0255]
MASPGAPITPISTTALTTNLSAWSNITSWTRFAPSLEDLILAGPRMLTRIGSIISFPEAIDTFDATGSSYVMTTTPAETATRIAEAVVNTANALEDDQDPAALVSRFTMEGSAKGLGSVFSYATSKWAICCVSMAIILNRTHIFAASRRRLRLTWPTRVALRCVPIILFAYQARQLLQAIQCQTSPDFAEMRWGNTTKTSDLMFADPVGYLHTLSSTLLMGATDYESCRAINMIPPNNHDFSNELRGSLSQLWPLFGTLCLSHFLETVSCAVQGRPVAVETGMTLFEHSLAFAEADAAVSNQLGWGLFSGSTTSNVSVQQASGASIAISRSMIMKRVNTPPEVLLIAFISSMSHITSHILGIFGLQNRYRLFSTGFWAMCFMGSLVIEAFNFSFDNPSSTGLFRFPMVCIIGFVPHLMVFTGILLCFAIYVFALLLAALEPPDPATDEGPSSFQERLRRAHANMQANVSLADIRITRAMDFYTALLRTGFGVITMASEAVYLNEDRNINVKNSTWLEEERYRELENLRMQWQGTGLGDSRYDSVGTIGLVPIEDGQVGAPSGYARERAAQNIPKSRLSDRRSRDGVGAAERSSRWLLALEFLMNINRLALRWGALVILKGLARIGVRRQPWLLLYLSRVPKQDKKDEKKPNDDLRKRLSSRRNGKYAILINDETADVEAEVRRRLRRSPETSHLPEEELDTRLYDSWKNGELWGNLDTSGDWQPDEDDDDWDKTSVITSVDDNNGAIEDQWVDDNGDFESEDEGQRTPTQARSRGTNFSRENTTFEVPIHITELARLLQPENAEERHEAYALAAHLRSDRIVTRSQFARMQHTQRGRLLLSNAPHGGLRKRGRMTEEEQANILEQLIISRREEAQREQEEAAPEYDKEEAEAGPPCVVCQAAPRKIIVWPCRCLSLCDDCRVTLAMNNFDKCVCCRREVISFSRIYVP